MCVYYVSTVEILFISTNVKTKDLAQGQRELKNMSLVCHSWQKTCPTDCKFITFLEPIRELRSQDNQLAPNLRRDRHLQGKTRHGPLLIWDRHNQALVVKELRLNSSWTGRAWMELIGECGAPWSCRYGRVCILLQTLLHAPHLAHTEKASLIMEDWKAK